jgi:uroporphyrinogen decarboxylase
MHVRTRLSSRERVNRMLSRGDQDRIPRHDTFWPETITRWQSEGLDGDASTVLQMLDSDFHGICWCAPTIYTDLEQVAQDERTCIVRDRFGKTVRHWKGRSGTPEHLAFECDNRDVWEKKFKPALLSRPIQLDVTEVTKAYRAGRERDRWIYLAGVEPFELTRYVMGDEVALMAMCEEPEWVRDFARVYTDVVLANYDAILASGIQPDGLWTYGDMAYNHATVCSPAHYRELIWPEHKRLAEWAHAHGMKFIFHTDGDVNGVIKLYIEAGFDCLQPLEAKANMDVRTLAPAWGEKLAFFGNIDAMKLASNDSQIIEQEIETKIAAGKSCRGYAYHSDHSVPPSVSWKTYQEMMRLVDKHGWY